MPGTRRGRRAALAIASTAALAVALTACSGSPSDTSSSSGPLDLKIGTLLPQTGTLAVLGPPEIAGVNLAVADINKADAGIKVTSIQKDSGDTSTNIATQSVTSLLSSGVSAIVGAASSSVSLSVIDQIVKAKVVQFSPANTSPTFTTYKDDGYYFRDAPSDVLQGRVLGQAVLKGGAINVAVLYQNDSYGQGLNTNVKSAIEGGGGTVAADVSFDPNATNFSAEVSKALASKPDALVVISFDQIKSIAQEIDKAGYPFSKVWGADGNYGVITPDFKNVDIAGAQFTNPGVVATDDFKSRLQAQVKSDGDKELSVFSYAPESYDATTLIALAALVGGKTDGTTIRDNLAQVSSGGEKCKSFAECAKLVKAGTKNIDYDGVSGPISLDKNGDPSQAYISIYKYAKGNTSSAVGSEFGDLTKQ
ncbi:ABC transporter substrate-binding protein [Amnibacterium kyonggiense]|uniref:Amino acid/amide ABC transporter substrate-binding protein (HAAT family) n=1 Tax=Amnibacterium kyonggiense TaxID=595671 RepID=A0A4R7FQV8_9MICO|nr:ABC transporter substrate-binding protein [Amnibacterium kyonggiense]TDS80177.1 amino acid/amide ABC transporter substrate-binding protein (HAAT family) [Amnibacterium kyonggiense]